MRTAAIAFAAISAMIVGLMAIGTHVFDIERIPESPVGGGWPGVLTLGLLVVSALMMAWRPPLGGLVVSLTVMANIAANWGDDRASMLFWMAVLGGLICLGFRMEKERLAAAKRAAIHERIDEELIDPSSAT